MMMCFVPPFATEEGPFWGRNVLLSEAVYHVSYAQKNHQIPIYRRGNESPLFYAEAPV